MSIRKKLGMSFVALLALLACVCFNIVFNGCGGKKTYEYRLTYSIFFPPVHIQTKQAEEWAREIEKRTNGRVKIDIFSGGVLSGAAENYDCVANGVSDLGMSCLSYSRGLFPMAECLDFPMGYPDGKTATLVANDFIAEFNPAEFNETHLLYLHAHGPGVLAARDNICSLDYMKNLSIRGTGITAQVIKQLDGNAVGLPQGETFEALRKGVVHATLCPIETLKGWKQGEVINYVVKIPAIGYTTAMFVTMNKKTWAKLPPDIQEVFTQVSKEFIPRHGAAWDEADLTGRQFVKELGKTFTEVTPAENERIAAKLEPIFGRWSSQAEARGLPGKKAVAYIRERIEHYSRSAK